jgi:NitT/TauT family transport system ATP-binding protein
VFQSFDLFPWRTAIENIAIGLELRGVPRRERRERARQCIELVGLAGFEDAYPSQLSGGMQQRVGIARALAVEPEILLMDEPFSQVDALTAESLRAEVLDIWGAKNRKLSSILLVSHDIKEVAYMADRIVILAANPGRLRTIVENRLPRPRDYRSRDLLGLVDYLHEVITRTELPDLPAAPSTPATTFEPLPDVMPSEVVGLLEYLDARGGKEDVFRIAADTSREFGHVILVVKAAEMLDLVDTPKRLAVLEPDGQNFVKARPEERQAIWRQHLLKIRLFRDVRDALLRQPDRTLDRDFVLETIVLNLPQESYEKVFETFLRWARFGGLFAYDEAAQTLALQGE